VLFNALAGIHNNGVHARFHLSHVNLNRAAENDSKISGAACEVSRIRAGNKRLRRHAAGVDAGSAE